MATTTSKRKKAVAATVAAAAILLAGTFAWTSISQQAKNEAIVDINPGGRLHDDFNGTNKDVYVENFNEGNDAVAIYARIRLDQYMEIGPDAGINVENGTADRNVKAITGTESKDKSTWVTYIPDGDKIEGTTVQAQNHWQWTLGNDTNNQPYYMPTFNKNKDSLLADINGTYEGTVNGDIVHYDDYKTYTATTDKATGTEIIDWDSDTFDEDGGVFSEQYNNGGVTTEETTPIDSADVLHRENQTHNAKQISTTAKVITMAEWQALPEDDKTNNAYWVYDTDGWAYWSKPIEPGKTTGLLLDGINMNKTPDENWYYAINVVGQFATPGDLRAFDQAAPTGGGGMTDAAKDMMAEVTKLGQTLTIETGNGNKTITPGGSTTITATEKSAGVELDEQPELTWTVTAKDPDGKDVSGQITFDEESGKLTVGEDVPLGTEITVKAETSDTPPVSTEITLTVKGMPEFTEDEEMIALFTPLGELGNPNDEYGDVKSLMYAIGGMETSDFEPKNLFVQIYDKNGIPLPLSNTVRCANYIADRGEKYVLNAEAVSFAPVGTKKGDEFTFIATYEKDGVTYGKSVTITWSGDTVTSIPIAYNPSIPTFVKDETDLPDYFKSVQELEKEAESMEGVSTNFDIPDNIDRSRVINVIAYSSTREGVTPTSYSFEVYDAEGKLLALEDYYYRSIKNTEEYTCGEALFIVPEGTERGSKFTYVLTYEIDGVTYGRSNDYIWNVAE